jgi:hypothetical protein
MIGSVTKKETTDITVKGIDRRTWLAFKANCRRMGLTVKGGVEQALQSYTAKWPTDAGGAK